MTLCLGHDSQDIIVRAKHYGLNLTAAGLISGRPGQGWRVFCQSW